MVLVYKWPFFLTFFLWNIAQKNVFYGILEQKKTLSRLSKQEVQKFEKLTFLPGFGLKMALFPTFIVYVI